MRILFLGCAALLATWIFYACNDKIEVQREYGFDLSTWYLPEEIAPDETVEIRFTLSREKDYQEAEYYVGYIQTRGKGEVCDAANTRLENREMYELKSMAGLDTGDRLRQRFTLFYHNTGEGSVGLRFVIRDNFGREKELDVAFQTVTDNL